MKKTLFLFTVLFGFVSFAQENTVQMEPIKITLQKQSTPSHIVATTTSVNTTEDNIVSKATKLEIIATKSATSLGEKATLSLADDKTNITNANEAKKIRMTAERSSKPQTVNITAVNSDQEE